MLYRNRLGFSLGRRLCGILHRTSGPQAGGHGPSLDWLSWYFVSDWHGKRPLLPPPRANKEDKQPRNHDGQGVIHLSHPLLAHAQYIQIGNDRQDRRQWIEAHAKGTWKIRTTQAQPK